MDGARHQMVAKGVRRDRPRSKGSLPGGGNVQHGENSDFEGTRGAPIHALELEPQSAENAQRRIRSAENQHRSITVSRNGPHLRQAVTPSASAFDRYVLKDDLQEDIPHFHQDLHPELKRPLSRKKDPSASAATGLGAFAGPARMMDAFEQRKVRQPIPVESWGPRPPSRAALPQKAAPLDAGLRVDAQAHRIPVRANAASASVGRPSGKTGGDQALNSKVSGGARASAWAEPQGLSSETRRGRERKAASRSSPDMATAATDFVIFGVGAMGSFQSHTGFMSPQRPARSTGQWAAHVDAPGALEDTSPTHCCVSPPTRRSRHALTEAVSVEDVDSDPDVGLHGSSRRDVTPPQVVITRSSQFGKSRGDILRFSDQRVPRDRNQRDTPFNTSLGVDFLSLFAS
mmetsp:Transcript_78229/g.216309  ORF Transcript_78229/g.216309 Transcript_78229/m.216309 type:complete len:402 (+) Transcript_78229:71-1276(+)|eukprot:CAMPEP_0179074442 /NCGR_PEP_ID=MMETSP0796-20121207/33087_1 /TAXON_ID=73915 /ORGANISM="Pyrodinium bahamense, Strain pbaha01" /LENGTH=401 /DNA_ID=CAMNT_0020771663 /DNA_START=57 /DNA_END=1262 /DNA_ORIENTATION=-